MKRSVGFTIVELLIVIVVIAILAAVSIIAYGGIQDRAQNARTVASVDIYYKALNMFYTDKGYYPDAYACLGVGYPNGQCWSGPDNTISESSTLMNSLKPYLGENPPEATIVYPNYLGNNRGGVVIDTQSIRTLDGKPLLSTLIYYQKGPNCGYGKALAHSGSSYTVNNPDSYTNYYNGIAQCEIALVSSS